MMDYHEEITHWVCPADGEREHYMVEKQDSGVIYCAYCRLTAWEIKMDNIWEGRRAAIEAKKGKGKGGR